MVEICARLDGLPLAFELAAARTKLFPPQALARRLSDRMTLLTGGSKDRMERHQTISNSLDWSFSLLTTQEQTLLVRLSVFVTSALRHEEAHIIIAIVGEPPTPPGKQTDIDLLTFG